MMLTRFVEASVRARTPEEVLAMLDAFLIERGVEMWSYHVLLEHLVRLNLEPGFVYFSFPLDWVDRYRSKGYFSCDPIIAQALNSATPYRWWDLEAKPDLSEAERAYLVDARAHLGEGYGIPVRGAHGTAAYFGIGSSEKKFAFDEAMLAIIQLACHQTHVRYLQLHGAIEVAPPKLTPRETEVISWVVKGKSNAVIAELLGISAHTVDTLMRRIYRKFDVADRTSAALRAVGFGLVTA